MRSSEVSSTVEEIYSREQYMRKREIFRKYKGSSSRVQEKDECKSKKARKVGLSRRIRL